MGRHVLRAGARRRGFALTAVIVMAVIFSIGAFGILSLSLGSRQRTEFHERRLGARYVSEAALIWAQQQLWINPSWCWGPLPGELPSATTPGDFPPPGLVPPFDDDGNPATPAPQANLDDGCACPCPAAAARRLTAQVLYTPP